MSNSAMPTKGPASADNEARVHLDSAAQTTALGREIAAVVRAGDCICLWGELGAGKTTLVRGLLEGLAERTNTALHEVPSPTFSIVQTYAFGDLEVFHFDLYRLSDPGELAEIGFDEALETVVTLIEWPERAGGHLPANRIDVNLDYAGRGRCVQLKGMGKLLPSLDQFMREQ